METSPLLKSASIHKKLPQYRRPSRSALVLCIFLTLALLIAKMGWMTMLVTMGSTDSSTGASPHLLDSPISLKCKQAPLKSPKSHPILDKPLQGIFRSSAYKSLVASHLASAVEIQTISFDDQDEGGKDRYAGFLKFHEFLAKTYPVDIQ